MITRLLALVLLTVLTASAAAQESPAPPLSEQAVEAAKLQERADRWQTASNFGLNVAIASALVGIVYTDELKGHPQADRMVVYGAAGGMATWAIGNLISRMLDNDADELLGVTVDPKPGGAAVRGSVSW